LEFEKGNFITSQRQRKELRTRNSGPTQSLWLLQAVYFNARDPTYTMVRGSGEWYRQLQSKYLKIFVLQASSRPNAVVDVVSGTQHFHQDCSPSHEADSTYIDSRHLELDENGTAVAVDKWYVSRFFATHPDLTSFIHLRLIARPSSLHLCPHSTPQGSSREGWR
jgi:hypothetical protein